MIIAATATAVAYYRHFDGQLTRVHGVISDGGTSELKRADGSSAPLPAPAANYLIVGTDSRTGANSQLPHTGGAACQCADTIILVHLPKGHAKAILVSIPRDSWVTIPAHVTSDGRHVPAESAKANAALSFGGPALMVRTVEGLTGLHVDHYVQVQFAGFVDMVDAVHGIDVCLSAPTRDPHTGIDLSAGVHHLDGAHALEYVRQRHGLPQGDLDRIKRQQAVIKQMVDKVLHAGVLLHPGQLTRFLDIVTRSVTVDDGLSFNDMRNLAETLSRLDRAHVQFATTPVADEGGVRDGQSVVLLDQPAVDQMFNAVARGSLPEHQKAPGSGSSSPRASASPPTVARSGVTCLR
ncbi:MAG: LCP family protein [Frankiaceae bacterium]